MKLEDKIADKSIVIAELVKFIEEQQILYKKDWDYICMIIDRDKGNVKPHQYAQIIEKCKEKNIRLFVTNPTFEFWLLLHAQKVFELTLRNYYLIRKPEANAF